MAENITEEQLTREEKYEILNDMCFGAHKVQLGTLLSDFATKDYVNQQMGEIESLLREI